MSPLKTGAENHPDSVRLAAYLESSSSGEFNDVRRHLVTCSHCRKEVSTIQKSLRSLEKYPPSLLGMEGREHPSEQIIADYVERRLPQGEFSQIQQHITECEDCLKASLHYALQSHSMQSVTEPILSEKRNLAIVATIKEFFNIRIPVWTTIPASALVVILLIVLFAYNRNEDLRIVAYQETPEVIFKASGGAGPGIGFFEGAREKAEPFDGITIVSQGGDHIHVKWPEIKTALLYEFKIFSTDEKEERKLIGQGKTSGLNEVTLQVVGVMSGKRYEWELSGKTTTQADFITRGGFVVGVKAKF